MCGFSTAVFKGQLYCIFLLYSVQFSIILLLLLLLAQCIFKFFIQLLYLLVQVPIWELLSSIYFFAEILFVEASFFFVSSMFTVAHWNIFIMVALKPLSDNSNSFLCGFHLHTGMAVTGGWGLILGWESGIPSWLSWHHPAWGSKSTSVHTPEGGSLVSSLRFCWHG